MAWIRGRRAPLAAFAHETAPTACPAPGSAPATPPGPCPRLRVPPASPLLPAALLAGHLEAPWVFSKVTCAAQVRALSPAQSLPLHICARMGTVVPGAARQRAVPAAWHDFWQLAFIPQPSGLVPWPLAVGDAPKRGSFGTVPRVAMGWERPLTQLLVPSPSALAFTAVDSLQTCFLSPSPRVWVSQAA